MISSALSHETQISKLFKIMQHLEKGAIDCLDSEKYVTPSKMAIELKSLTFTVLGVSYGQTDYFSHCK